MFICFAPVSSIQIGGGGDLQPMADPLDTLRRPAKFLHKKYKTGDRAAIDRVNHVRPCKGDLKHADFLHVIAKENDFASWPQMKVAVEAQVLDRATKQQRYLDRAAVRPVFEHLLQELVGLPGGQAHIAELVAVGVPWDRPAGTEVTQAQITRWQGLPDLVAYCLRQGPDLGYVNGYGETLLSTIIHDSESCLDRVLEHGVVLAKRTIDLAGQREAAAFLSNWADQHPGQMVEHGIV